MDAIEVATAKRICELAMVYGAASSKAEETFRLQVTGRATEDARRKAEEETRQAYAALVDMVYDLVPPAAWGREREANSSER